MKERPKFPSQPRTPPDNVGIVAEPATARPGITPSLRLPPVPPAKVDCTSEICVLRSVMWGTPIFPSF